MSQARSKDRESRVAVTTPSGQDSKVVQAHAADLKDELDELLDEIDTVLEENMWVDKYVQKGGQ